jgi:thioredoxin 1
MTTEHNLEENPDHPIHLTSDNFHDAVKQYPFLVVDCWAEWCAPCWIIAPIIEEMAKEYQGKIVFGKVDADQDPEILGEFGIMSIPTLLIFKDGQKVDQIVGAMPRPMLELRLQPHMA